MRRLLLLCGFLSLLALGAGALLLLVLEPAPPGTLVEKSLFLGKSAGS